jgi:signal transduction histidine kinase
MRRNLTILVAASTSAVVLALVIPLALLVGRLAQDRAVSAATQQAQSVALLVATETGTATGTEQLSALLSQSDQRTGLRTSVVPAKGSALGPAVVAADLSRARAGQSFTRLEGEEPDGAAVYLPVAIASGTTVVRVGVTKPTLTHGVARARALLVALGLGLVAFSLAAAVLLARRVSAPLVRVAEVAHDLRRGQLQRRVVPGGPPEVQEVGIALNQLAGRIGELLQAEREAAADLSHRLRTPVTALRLAIDATADGDERARLREQLDRLESTVDAVVRQSRQPATGAGGAVGADGETTIPLSADLSAIAAERVTFWSALAEDQQRDVRRSIDAGATVRADPQDLVDALDVLLDNVFAHTATGVGFAVGVHRTSRLVELVVEDDGSGLPAPDQLGRGRSSAGSTGLGLDIVRRIAAATGAELTLGTGDGGGARVSLRWPAAADHSDR